MRASEFLSEEKIGVAPKRTPRNGSRPSRGHNVEPRYKDVECEIDEAGKASKKLCLSKKTDDELLIQIEGIATREQALKLVPKQVWFTEEDFKKIADNSYLTGYWQSEKYFEDISHIIRDDFSIKHPMAEQDKMLKRFSK